MCLFLYYNLYWYANKYNIIASRYLFTSLKL